MANETFDYQVDATQKENDLLEVALGYQRVLQRVTKAAAQRAQGDAPVDERLLMAVLGAVSLQANLDRWLRRAQAAPSDKADAPSRLQESLLR